MFAFDRSSKTWLAFKRADNKRTILIDIDSIQALEDKTRGTSIYVGNNREFIVEGTLDEIEKYIVDTINEFGS